jgi:hypothetical protein
MPELPFLDEYSGQTTEELIALEGKYRTDSLVLVFDQALNQKWARVGDEGLTEEDQTILAVEALENQVNNGGYDQFFANEPDYIPTVVKALERIGCPKTAQITRLAVGAAEQFPDEDAADGSDEREDALADCDEQFFHNDEPIAERLFEYIKSNKDKIKL